jgi:DNA-binding transcriptional regulator YhcF (GntR family)
VATAILDGSLASGSTVPSARSLSGQLGIHYHTVNKSYLRLRHDGFLVLSRRREWTARRPPSPGPSYLADWNDRQSALLSEALGHGVSPQEIHRRLSRLLELARRPRTTGERDR